MNYRYDFHIHTALSPCGDDLMTPHNIVNMCKLNGLDIIAITDHNTLGNCEAVMKVGKSQELLIIPGMEIECIEEFHNIALFPSLEAGKQIEEVIKKYRLPIKNKVSIFGNQYLLDEKDEVVGEEEHLLVTACQLSAQEIYTLVNQVGGVIYPAHIDRNTYSILSNLGTIPEEMDISIVEVSFNSELEIYKRKYPNYRLLQSSDAHYLDQLCIEYHTIMLERLEVSSLFRALSNK